MAGMNKEQPSPETPETSENGSAEPSPAGELPQAQAAKEAVCRAKDELKKAREVYREIRQQATDQIRQAREKTVGDLIDSTLRQVRKHPGPGVLLAAVVGFFLGRLFRR